MKKFVPKWREGNRVKRGRFNIKLMPIFKLRKLVSPVRVFLNATLCKNGRFERSSLSLLLDITETLLSTSLFKERQKLIWLLSCRLAASENR